MLSGNYLSTANKFVVKHKLLLECLIVRYTSRLLPVSGGWCLWVQRFLVRQICFLKTLETTLHEWQRNVCTLC